MALTGWALTIPALAWALYASREGEEQESTLGALLAAFLFAAQTFQFPVPGGTSGHLVGATLVVILCGPALGLVILAAVVILQAVVFGDGGLLTLGWNLNNMGLAAGLVGGTLYGVMRKWRAPVFGAAFVSAWVATQMGALCTALELAWAGVTPLMVSLAAMLGVQAFVGIGEGLVTASAVSFLLRARPKLVSPDKGLLWPGAAILTIIGLCTLAPPSLYSLEPGLYPAALAYLALLALTALSALILHLWGRTWRH